MPLDNLEFANNSEQRCPCILLLDTSSSMGEGHKIGQLNAGLVAFRDSLGSDPLASKRVEIAIITFDSNVQVAQNFVTVDDFVPPSLGANGGTSMGAGINAALDLIQSRKQEFRQNGVLYYRPWMFMITDGYPTDDTTEAVKRLKSASANNELAFFAVGVDGADMATLKGITPSFEPVKLDGLKFREMFMWLSKSLQRVSHSKTDEQVKLASPDSWVV